MEFSFYDEETGLLTGAVFLGSENNLEMNTPPGCRAIAGRHSPVRHRVDLATKRVVDYTPPEPTDAEWIAQNDMLLKAQMQQIEADQNRAVRDILLALTTGRNPPQDAVQALQDVEDVAAALRAELGKRPK